MQYFTKVTTDLTNPIFLEIIKHPLALAILIVAASRARRSDSAKLGLRKGEFVLSEIETHLFGLKPSQKGLINRERNRLIQGAIIEKTGRKTGNKGATIYRFINNDIVSWVSEIGSKIGNESQKNRERKPKKQGETKNVVKNEYKERVKILLSLLNEQLRTSKFPLTEEFKNEYANFVGEDSDMSQHKILEEAIRRAALKASMGEPFWKKAIADNPMILFKKATVLANMEVEGGSEIAAL